MVRSIRAALLLSTLLTSLLLTACGGGSDGGGGNRSVALQPANAVTASDPSAPQATGDTATDGLAWFNFRRQKMGLQAVERNAKIDVAAKAHSDYQVLNGISHDETAGKPGFTGATLIDRLRAADYAVPAEGYAIGEVISMTSDPSGFNAAEGLIAAIYHRFVAFEPMYRDAGAGSSISARGETFFTANFAVLAESGKGLQRQLADAKIVTYPYPDQQLVPIGFLSDNEVPDPVPSKNAVGYPISVHADGIAILTVRSFTVQERGGATLPVQLLTGSNDAEHTPLSAAAIIPLDVLKPATTYDVSFSGTLDKAPVSRSWSFTTAAAR
ncbi:CAP domain-containing protein [Noviherbaspirillum massiliense]|uniref:CAP domain-containing protein n=1 Tax=Noviherbaspirillum massiliense TaxID=1465823 RepID=UPI0002EC18C8|nr:CAP domain-containing protein [Noviherbaspirillum massiliense]